MRELDLEIKEITQRKDELAVKLSDLASMKFVIDELEKKIQSLQGSFDEQTKAMSECKQTFKSHVIQSKERMVAAFIEVEAKIQG